MQLNTNGVSKHDRMAEWNVLTVPDVDQEFGYQYLGSKKRFLIYDRVVELEGEGEFLYEYGGVSLRKDKGGHNPITVNGRPLGTAVNMNLELKGSWLCSNPPKGATEDSIIGGSISSKGNVARGKVTNVAVAPGFFSSYEEREEMLSMLRSWNN